jgi:hypothetical protein
MISEVDEGGDASFTPGAQVPDQSCQSPGYCALVRRDDRIPAPHHWAAFQLAGLQAVE